MPNEIAQPEQPPGTKRRPAWAEWLWLIFPVLGGSLLLPWGPDWLRTMAAVILWAIGGTAFVVSMGAFALLAFVPNALRPTLEQPRWTRRRRKATLRFWLRRLFSFICLIVAPLSAGRPYLAGCYALVFVMLAGFPDPKGSETERDPDRPRRISKAIFWTQVTFWRLVAKTLAIIWRVGGWCLVLLALPFIGLGIVVAEGWKLAGRPWRDRSLASRLREALDLPRGGVYFVHGEQHQYDHFLGPGGVLLEFIDAVVVRDWRRDIKSALEEANANAASKEVEDALLDRFGVSNRREHLPFVAVIDADNRLNAVRLSDAYRRRRSDGGVALAEAERRLRSSTARSD